jgi:hypothetical protein
MNEIDDAARGVEAFLAPVMIPRLEKELTHLSQGHDLVGKDGGSGTCLSRVPLDSRAQLPLR